MFFVIKDQLPPAGLVRMLLLITGIEPNPGPIPGQGWICSVCNQQINERTQTSVKCNKCNNWCHLRKNKETNCSQLKSIRNYSLVFKCPTCCDSNNTTNKQPNTTSVCDSNNTTSQQPTTTTTSQQPTYQQSESKENNQPKNYDLKILQLNCNGIRNKSTELNLWLKENDIKIAAIQETKLTNKSKPPNFPNYTLIRKDRERDTGGGLAFLVHETIPFEPLPDVQLDKFTEYLAIKVDNIKIVNIYIPPASSCDIGFSPNLDMLFTDNSTIIMGDFNAHDPLWFSPIQDSRGTLVSDEIGASSFGVLNLDMPTRTSRNSQPTSPDISLAGPPLLPYCNWTTSPSLGSDHLPIVITCTMTLKLIMSENKTYINFKKADWVNFTLTSEEEISKLNPPTDVYRAEQDFREVINRVSRNTIPQGRIKEIFPEVPTTVKNKILERNELRK